MRPATFTRTLERGPIRPRPHEAFALMARGARPPQDTLFSGDLKAIGLFPIVQTLAASGCTGSLVIASATQRGSVYLHKGQLVFVSLGSCKGPKAFYRLSEMTEGRFAFFSPGRKPLRRNMTGRLEEHLLRAARQHDELRVLRSQLPPLPTRLRVSTRMTEPLQKLKSSVLEVMAAVEKYGTLAATLDGCSLPDLEMYSILITLLNNRDIEIMAPNPESAPSSG